MFIKYLYEKPYTVLFVVTYFVSAVLAMIVFFFLPFNPLEKDGLIVGMLGILVSVFIISIPLLYIFICLIKRLGKNANRMIAYANGNHAYSDVMRESIRQTDTPDKALHHFATTLHEQYIQEERAKESATQNQTIQEFEKAKRDLH